MILNLAEMGQVDLIACELGYLIKPCLQAHGNITLPLEYIWNIGVGIWRCLGRDAVQYVFYLGIKLRELEKVNSATHMGRLLGFCTQLNASCGQFDIFHVCW